MTRRNDIALAVYLLYFTSSAQSADWPAQRHDNQRSGVTPESSSAAALVESWTYGPPHPPQPAWYGPAKRDAYARVEPLRSMRAYDKAFHVTVADGMLYFWSSADDAVHCLDVVTGREQWAFFTGGPVRVAPAYAGGRVYFGSDDGFAYCLDARKGSKVWTYSPDPDGRRILCNGKLISPLPCRTGVLIADGTAYCGFSMLPWETGRCACRRRPLPKPPNPRRLRPSRSACVLRLVRGFASRGRRRPWSAGSGRSTPSTAPPCSSWRSRRGGFF